MKPERLKLSDSARLIVAETKVILYSELGTMVLDDAEIARLVNQLLPLLDGTRTQDEIVNAFPHDTRANIRVLLNLFARRCLLDKDKNSTSDPESLRTQERFFQAWSDNPEGFIKRIRQARVLIIGLETSGVVAASQLAASGITALHLADDDHVIDGDHCSSLTANANSNGRPRREAVAEHLREAAPWCRVTTSSMAEAEGLCSEEDPESRWDLMLGTMLPEAVADQIRWARIAHEAKLISLFASCAGLEAVIGPLVVPGASACWNCARLRMLANAEDAFAAHILQHSFVKARPHTSLRAMPVPMSSLPGHLLSLEALKILSGYVKSQLRGQILIQNLVTLQTSFHKIIPMPWCEVCGGAAAMEQTLSSANEPGDLLQFLSGWIDPRTGVISEVAIRQLDSVQLNGVFCAAAFSARYTEGVHDDADTESCGGKGLSEADAIMGAIGEAIERYSAARVRLQNLRCSPLPPDTEDFLDPRQLCLYDESQYAQDGFPFRRFDPDRSHYWVEGQWLDNGEPVWAPALMTYYNFPGGDAFCQVTTNGLAAGLGLRDATLRAVFELIERDVFMMSWLCRRPARRLLVDDSIDRSTRDVIAQLERHGATIEVYLLNGDGDVDVPVVACLGLGDGVSWPGLTVTSAAHLSARTAVRSAVLEQAYSGLYLRHRMLQDKRTASLKPEQIRNWSFLDHGLFYLPAERAANSDFLRSGSETVSVASLTEPVEISLDDCARRLTCAGLRVAVVDVTAPDVAQTPLRVVRALGVKMQPIYCGYGMHRLANPRLLAQSRGKLNPDIPPLC